MDPNTPTWQAAARAAAADVGLLAADYEFTPESALARLSMLRNLMAHLWVYKDVPGIGDPETLLLDAGAVAYSQQGAGMRDIVATVIDKQRSYGVGNILAFGMAGIAVRMSDKIERLRNLLATGHTPERSEPLADTWLDIVGYSIVGMLLVRGQFELPLSGPDE